MMNEFEKGKIFFRPYISSLIYDCENQKVEESTCRELLGDCIPNDNAFLLSYFKKFPNRLDDHIFDIAVDTELRNIMHDIVLRHACEYINSNCDF